MSKIKGGNEPSWRDTLRALRACNKVPQVEKMLAGEMAGANRLKWKQAMLGRLRVLRKPAEEAQYGISK